MNIQLTSTQTLKSLAGAALFGAGVDLADKASCQLSQLAWLVLRDTVSQLFWGVLSGLQASQASAIENHLYFLGCPAEILSYARSILSLVGGAF